MNDDSNHYLVGGGIASLAAAVFLVRDAGVSGENIHVLEQLPKAGGSLDGSGDDTDGYLVRGGRMFEEHFACTFNLLSSIPSVDDPAVSVKDDIFAFNQVVHGRSNCRLVRHGKKADMDHFGLSPRDTLALNRLMMRTEHSLSDRTIGSCFKREFFSTNFWYMWSTTFSFQPWHSAVEMRRYLRRFIHLFPGFKRLEGILRTRYNQYDSLIAPVQTWLETQGVNIQTATQVIDVHFRDNASGKRHVTELVVIRDGQSSTVDVDDDDKVYLTLGSMTAASSTGSNDNATPAKPPGDSSWSLWQRLAARYSDFGDPQVFCCQPDKTCWQSFTVTLADDDFLAFMEAFTGNLTGTGGLVTFPDSGWLMSIVMFHQPHFKDQASHRYVFWGYGLRGDRTGDFVKKPLYECNGAEILDEVAGQLNLGQQQASLFRNAVVIPCRMPYITSHFMPRRSGDRPPVVPDAAENYALLGQFVEMPRDTVFTVEYSVRSAMQAVYSLTGRSNPPPRVHRSDLDPAVLARATATLLEG